MDGSKLRGARLAAARPRSRTGLAETVDWYLANEAWWRAARSGDWDAYYERQYGAAAPAADSRRADAGRRHRRGRAARVARS